MSESPTVSLLIPCHNAERWIAGTIESALAQSWQPLEVIVVDDGSSDRSLSIVKRFGDAIRWEAGPQRGGNAARNRLLELARGEWLQYLDADDYLLPDKVANQAQFVMQQPGTDVVFGPVLVERWCQHRASRQLLAIPEPHDLWVLLARWYLPQTGAALWRKQALMDIGGWAKDQPCCQEHDLYLRLLMAGKVFAYWPHNGAVYRQWSPHTVSNRDQMEVYRRRLAVTERAEQFLRRHDALTGDRREAINQSRFEIARLAWQYCPRLAVEIMEAVRASQPTFVPAGAAAPKSYRMIYQLFGFRIAEHLAALRRTWLETGNSHPAAAA